jgi:hypothetical protein
MPFNWDRRNRGNPRKYPNYFRNCVQMISTVLMKQACFIVPDGSLCYKHVQLLGSKKAIARITVLCCSNMSRTDKKKLFVVGKSAKPRCFKRLKMDSLPVEYYANKNAWMTSEIFKKWLMRWDVDLQQKSRKVLLSLDNGVAHPQCSECLKNTQLEFLPVNTTSLVQAMDMGIKKFEDVVPRKVGESHPRCN